MSANASVRTLLFNCSSEKMKFTAHSTHCASRAKGATGNATTTRRDRPVPADRW